MISDFILRAEADGWVETKPEVWIRHVEVPLSDIGDEKDFTVDTEFATIEDLFEMYRGKE